ncbi:MAG: hypothetical protein HYW89_01110 [Candidatus Sungiibacteriota bacterium]|uniref:Uncharacterized protein n=1 Tax=Candidatus Sungiibacteriota bacterium TaxID=2750080 RepID=A0A7T5RJX1_9BACT|nr:MAG: hypothetical protein HYW89_01110 [Candidatus Sungbacteria bacterium]
MGNLVGPIVVAGAGGAALWKVLGFSLGVGSMAITTVTALAVPVAGVLGLVWLVSKARRRENRDRE